MTAFVMVILQVLLICPVPVFADSTAAEVIRIMTVDDGAYEIIDGASESAAQEFAVAVEGVSGVFMTSSGVTLLRVSGDQFQAVDYLSISISNKSEMDTLAVSSQLPPEIALSIKNDFDTFGFVDAALYCPAVTGTTNGLTTMASSSSQSSYTYNGRNMRQYLYTNTNLSSGYQYVAQGVQTKSIASSLGSIAVTIAGTLISEIGIVSSAVSIFLDFLNITGLSSSAVSAHSNDYLQINAFWDRTEKYTYVEFPPSSGEYMLGAATESVKVLQFYSAQYYANQATLSNSYGQKLIAVNQYVHSPHYVDPNAVAVQYAGGDPFLEHNMYGYVGGLNIYF
jgi:hypothetical protein